MLFPTTIAGSLPKPEWLAEPNTLWAPWKSSGEVLARAKRDATMLAVKLQEDAGVDHVDHHPDEERPDGAAHRKPSEHHEHRDNFVQIRQTDRAVAN